MKVTSVFSKNIRAYNAQMRYIVNKGSTRSSKTYSQLQLLYLIALWSKKPLVISIVSESMPHLKKGCIRDFKEILQNNNNWNEDNWNATDKFYSINNSTIEFFSADTSGKVHGAKRDILYLNECINIEYEIFRQLDIRTTQTIFLDCNPSFEFWLDNRVLMIPKDEKEPDVLIKNDKAILIHSTYKDNEFLGQIQIDAIESNRHDKDWWRVYGEGLTGTLKGSIMKDWEIVHEMPKSYKNRWIGLDFGFTNDPTAIVDVRLSDGKLWIDELLYSTGYDNLMISKHLELCEVPKDVLIIADSAEPKSISEIRSQGWRIEGAIKGKDSVTIGLQILNRYKKNLTNRSINIIKEYRNYRWQVDENDNPTNRPMDKFNHSIDAQRYVCLNKLAERNGNFSYSVMPGKRDKGLY